MLVCPHIETSQLIWTANQLTGFCMWATLAFNGLKFSSCHFGLPRKISQRPRKDIHKISLGITNIDEKIGHVFPTNINI